MSSLPNDNIIYAKGFTLGMEVFQLLFNRLYGEAKKTSFVAHTAYVYNIRTKEYRLIIGNTAQNWPQWKKPQKQWAFEFSSPILFFEFLSLTRNMNAQVRNTSEFSRYLDIQNAKNIFKKGSGVGVTQEYDFLQAYRTAYFHLQL